MGGKQVIVLSSEEIRARRAKTFNIQGVQGRKKERNIITFYPEEGELNSQELLLLKRGILTLERHNANRKLPPEEIIQVKAQDVNKALVELFRGSLNQNILNRNKTIRIKTEQYIFLENIRKSNTKSRYLGLEDIVPIIHERIARTKYDNLFEYLGGAYQRLHKIESMRIVFTENEITLLEEIIVSHIWNILAFPESFNIEDELLMQNHQMFSQGTSKYHFTQIQDHWSDFFTPSKQREAPALLVSLYKKALQTEDGPKILFEPIFEKIHIRNEENSFAMIGEFRDRIFQILDLIEMDPKIAVLYCKCPNFAYDNPNGRILQDSTFLGRILRPTVFPSESNVGSDYIGKGSFHAQLSLTRTLSGKIEQMMQTIANFLKTLSSCSPYCKTAILSYFDQVKCSNQESKKEISNNRDHFSTNGFLFNCLDVLLRMIKPYIFDPSLFVKMFFTLQRSFRDPIFGASYKNGWRSHGKPIQDQIAEQSILFCNISDFVEVVYPLKDYIEEVKKSAKKKLDKEQVAIHTANYLSYETHIQGKEFMHNLCNYISFFCGYSLFLTRNEEHVVNEEIHIEEFLHHFKVPFRSVVGEEYNLLSTDINGIIAAINFYASYGNKYYKKEARNVFYMNKHTQLAIIIVHHFANMYSMSLNPHVKATLIEFFYGIIDHKNLKAKNRNYLFREYISYPFIKNYSMEILLRQFNDVERTGRHAQFHEKFGYRRQILVIFQYFWSQPGGEFVNKFNELERGKPGLFELFINYLLNDFIETFDEAFNKLKEVKHFEILMASSQLREQETALAIKDKIKANNINKNTISYYLLLGTELLESLAKITYHAKEVVLNEEIGAKFVTALNYNLDNLLNEDKFSQIDIADPKAVSFNRALFLTDLMSIYVNLGESDVFAGEIAKDTRSYSNTLFSDFLKWDCKENPFRGMEDNQIFITLFRTVRDIRRNMHNNEELFADAPEEFYDNLTGEIMVDPVLLPTSNQILDYQTIRKHLLNDPTDPYNRQPLSITDLIPKENLKQRIELYKMKKIAEQRSENHE